MAAFWHLVSIFTSHLNIPTVHTERSPTRHTEEQVDLRGLSARGRRLPGNAGTVPGSLPYCREELRFGSHPTGFRSAPT